MDSTGAQKVYASVKSYSQRDELLPKSILQSLSESRDLDELVVITKNTKYVDDVEKITNPKMNTKILNGAIWISTVPAMIFALPALGIFLGIYYFTGNLITSAILGMHLLHWLFQAESQNGF